MSSESFDTQMLIKLESPNILPTAFPTRMWTGAGPILLDVGDGAGSVQWTGTTFGNIETAKVADFEKAAEGTPKRITIGIAVDETRSDIRAAIIGRDSGPLTATLYFIVREEAGPSLPPLSIARTSGNINWRQRPKDQNLDEENAFKYLGNDTFDLMVRPFHRKSITEIAVPGNRLKIDNTSTGKGADMEILYAYWRSSSSPISRASTSGTSRRTATGPSRRTTRTAASICSSAIRRRTRTGASSWTAAARRSWSGDGPGPCHTARECGDSRWNPASTTPTAR